MIFTAVRRSRNVEDWARRLDRVQSMLDNHQASGKGEDEAGGYYDGDTLDNPKGRLESLDRTPGALGIMYTTWRNKYELLAPFGDLVPGELPR